MTNDEVKAIIWSLRLLGIDDLRLTDSKDYDSLRNHLAAYLDYLADHNLHRLFSVLYRIDVAQDKVEKALSSFAENQTPGQVLADFIIERQVQKLKFRKEFSRN